MLLIFGVIFIPVGIWVVVNPDSYHRWRFKRGWFKKEGEKLRQSSYYVGRIGGIIFILFGIFMVIQYFVN